MAPRLPFIVGLLLLSACATPPGSPGSGSAVLRVGPGRTVTTIAEASRLAQPGQTIEVDAGLYRRDIAVWTQDRLTLRAVGGRVRLIADGAAAEGKGIWVVRARDMHVEGFDFEGARVPSRNGAGIRFEQGSLRVRDCSFIDNEMGLLTGNDPTSELEVEASEFAHNRRPDGHNHNLYVGTIARFSVKASYFHHATVGHLLKSRAATSWIAYNRITDEVGGSASYELEFPNGGVATVVGNVIEQVATTQNETMVSFGAEGYKWPRNEIRLVHNTLVDRMPQGGRFLYVRAGSDRTVVAGNLLAGSGSIDPAGADEYRGNASVALDSFEDPAGGDWRLRRDAPLRERGQARPEVERDELRPTHEYLHPRRLRALDAPPALPGALQG